LFEHPTIESFAQLLLSQIPSQDVANALVDVEALSEAEARSLLRTDVLRV